MPPPKRFDRVERETIENRRRRRRRRFASAEVFSSLCLSLSRSHQLSSPPSPPNHNNNNQNPLSSGSPLETLKKKSDAAYTWVQNEQAEVANTAYRLKTIYQQNKTVPRKYLTCESSGEFFLFYRDLERDKRERERVKREEKKERSCTQKMSIKSKKKHETVLNTSLSYFDAAWARAREIRLHPDTTIAIKKEVRKKAFELSLFYF